MKNKFYLIFLTIFFTIFPFLVMGQADDLDINCEYTLEQLNGDDVMSLKINCSSTAFELITKNDNSFFLLKIWTYGELFISFLLILILFLVIFILVFNFFFEPVFKIRGKR